MADYRNNYDNERNKRRPQRPAGENSGKRRGTQAPGGRPPQRNDGRRPAGSRPAGGRPASGSGRPANGRPASGRASGQRYERNVYGKRPGSRNSRNRKNKLIVTVIVIVIIIAMLIVGILSLFGSKNNKEEVTTKENTENITAAGADADADNEITLLAVGDIIGHDTILELAKTANGYDFSSLFAPLKNDISSVDIAIANMETPFGGTESGPYIGYPSFNTPDEMGDAITDAGFDVVQLASNHSMDSGVTALDHELNYWKGQASKALAVGVNGSEEAKNTIPILEKKGVKIAFLNYTYGLNGNNLPDERGYAITLLTDENRDFIRSQIEKAGEQADFVVVLPHWGTEYEVGEPTAEQVSWAGLFTEAGADLIIGTHPHVIEKVDWVEAGGNKALCYYSLGNFVSNQQYTNTVLGAMAYVTLTKDDTGVKINEEKTKVIPVVTHNDKTGEKTRIAVYYLADYTDEMASVHDTKLSFEDDFSVAKMKDIVNGVFSSNMIKDRVN